jgi:threonylcarbamoyladenosine tRNA methylthiotransferase MtaB
MEIIDQFRTNIPDFNFTTDVIVGFPGETEEEFLKTVKIAEEVQFGHIHTFRYSRRTGTRADRMDDQIPEKIKVQRSEIIRNLSEKKRKLYLESTIGKEQKVLIEKIDTEGLAHGYGENYIPVIFKPGTAEKNHFEKVTLDQLTGEGEALALFGSTKKLQYDGDE